MATTIKQDVVGFDIPMIVNEIALFAQRPGSGSEEDFRKCLTDE